MDQSARQRLSNHASLIADAGPEEVLWLGKGRTRETIRPVFKRLDKYCESIEALAMDWNIDFDFEIKEHCPTA
ncbi:hypothetical protein DDZ13_07815 [Coraliomargarita sinensis]|uniref:Transposase IS204/IS1001/IS1096/IS1165 DDE domain-containing protein n=1 Tax=Coraliomargarita sinensis TaxID=2174842 RepID=A0A317ZKT7_9BACT|nr:transposase [Coraliomargarita sinensis]PXA04429.1 hypothetical protein DDZ13_07815 [Coraliomargarita sinensis]